MASAGIETIALILDSMGLTYKREHQFCESRNWALDFALESCRVAIEYEGGQWVKGRHQTGSGFLGDIYKYNAALLLGWRILRFTTDHLRDPEYIRRALLMATSGTADPQDPIMQAGKRGKVPWIDSGIAKSTRAASRSGSRRRRSFSDGSPP